MTDWGREGIPNSGGGVKITNVYVVMVLFNPRPAGGGGV